MHLSSPAARCLAVFSVLLASLPACTPKSGTRLSTDITALQSIKSLHLSVTQTEPYTVLESNSPTKSMMIGGIAFGAAGALVGAGIDSARSTYNNSMLEAAVAPQFKDFDAKALLAATAREALINSHHFDHVELATQPESELADGTLKLAIQTWGLRSCVGSESTKDMQVEFHIVGTLTHQKEGRTIWERNEVYRDSICRPILVFLDHPTLLRERLTQSIESVSGRLINRILYP